MGEMIRLAGDWAPKKRVVQHLPWDDLLIANLEGPVLDGNDRSSDLIKSFKAGPNLMHYQLPTPIKNNPGNIMVLANNHMMDYGAVGLEKTIKLLDDEGWSWVGAGVDSFSAKSPIFLNWKGIQIGILSRCEVQFGIVTERKPGVAPLDASIYHDIRKLKKKVDLVIVSIHAAVEMCPFPSPKRQDDWRALIEAGADIVHGHHSHVPQGWESYEGGLIFYGLGNFCVDPAGWSHYPNALWSLVPELSWATGNIEMHPTTTVIQDLGEEIMVRNANVEESAMHLNYLACCNRPLSDRRLLEALWQETSIRLYLSVYAKWLGFDSGSLSHMDRVKNFTKSIAHSGLIIARKAFRPHSVADLHRHQYLLWYHLFACDSHNDVIATALGVLGGELEDLRCEESSRMIEKIMPGLA